MLVLVVVVIVDVLVLVLVLELVVLVEVLVPVLVVVLVLVLVSVAFDIGTIGNLSAEPVIPNSSGLPFSYRNAISIVISVAMSTLSAVTDTRKLFENG